MRILLLGELSGVHQELRPALIAQGHEVVTGHNRLAYAGFDSDIPFFRPDAGSTNRLSWAREMASQLVQAPKLAGFDVVQIMTHKFFNWKIHKRMLRYLKRHNRRLVVINTTCTSHYHRQVIKLAYSPCAECKQFDLKADRCIFDSEDEREAERLAFEAADAIVATHYEYAWALDGTPFAPKVAAIPLPVDISAHRPSPMPATPKIRIWYGETRHGFKGGTFIHAALDKLEEGPNADKVEVLRTGRLPFAEYLELLDTVHIVIDQASSFGTGMNGLYALARGRVVLSGAEPETLDFYGVPEAENPVINIKPDPDMIAATVEALVADRPALEALGRRSAEYAAKYHSADVVAAQYVALYRRLLEPPSSQPQRAAAVAAAGL